MLNTQRPQHSEFIIQNSQFAIRHSYLKATIGSTFVARCAGM
jgi:hypothetical protein